MPFQTILNVERDKPEIFVLPARGASEPADQGAFRHDLVLSVRKGGPVHLGTNSHQLDETLELLR